MKKLVTRTILFALQHQRKILLLVAGILFLLLLLFFFRSPLASWYIQRKIDRFNRTHQSELKVEKVRILGLASIRMTGISLMPAGGDTLLKADTAYVSIGILKLFAGRLSIHDVQLVNLHLNVINDSTSSNWKFLFAPKTGRQEVLQRAQAADSLHGLPATGETGTGDVPAGDQPGGKAGSSGTGLPAGHDSTDGIQAAGAGLPQIHYARMAERMFDFIFDKIPLNFELKNLTIRYSTNGHTVDWSIGRLDLRDHFFRTTILIREDSLHTTWNLAGLVDNHQRKAEFRVYPGPGAASAAMNPGRPGAANGNTRKNTGTGGEDSGALVLNAGETAIEGSVRIPFLKYRWNAGIGFDTLAFGIRESLLPNDRVELTGFASVTGLEIDHRKVAAGPVSFEKLAVDYRLLIGDDYIEIDSTTRVDFNKTDLHPYVRYRSRPSHQVVLSVHKPWFRAQDLFASLPPGLFTVLEGISVRGQLAWHLDFRVDLANPDSLYFDTSLDRQQFGVNSYGSSDLARLNEPFVYTAYEKGEPVRSFVVGPENPNFRYLHQISPYLQHAVMTSEDGGFYQHRGFLPDAFRESIITNIKERRFARGGSTISMQLVKNVFLSRNKTIARKLEEALIVWLIENQGLCTKERMFEVYLNIIEWGPLVYGANEASRFYFKKDAGRLTLAEAIFLASIIPRPKAFRWAFDDNGRLRDYNAEFYRLVTNKMLSKGWIAPADAEHLKPEVDLKGPARLMLKNPDTTSIFVEPE